MNFSLREEGSEGDNGRGAAALTRQVSGSVFDRWSVAKKGRRRRRRRLQEMLSTLCARLPLPYLLEVEYFNMDEFPRRLLTGFMNLTLNLKIYRARSLILAAERYQFISEELKRHLHNLFYFSSMLLAACSIGWCFLLEVRFWLVRVKEGRECKQVQKRRCVCVPNWQMDSQKRCKDKSP